MFCPNCGTDAKDAAFCPNCGAKLGEDTVAVSAMPTATEQLQPQPQAPAPKKKKGKKGLVVLASLVALIVIIAIAGSGSKKKGDKDQPIETANAVVTETTTVEETTAAAVWKLCHYVDDFKEEVASEWYIEGDFVGVFSNSATTDSKCTARVLYDYRDKATIFLYDYGRSQLKNYGSRSDAYTVKVKTANGDIKSFSAYIPGDGDRIWLENSVSFINTIKAGDVTVHIYENDSELHNYNFTIKSDNFAALLAEQK